ncbi:MAG: HPr(Ser) kinase/phosphatase [Candidatus Sumerlaeota bacterium]
MKISVQRMLKEKGDTFDLTLLTGSEGLELLITQSELHRPGLAFAGFLEIFTYDRIQIVGNTEVRYLNSLPSVERRKRIEAICQFRMPCIIVTASNDCPQELIDCATAHKIPLLKTTHETSRFTAMLSFWLEREFAPVVCAHGVFVDIFGEGVLITGGSGIGKSECGLELIERGHRLVSDDVVLLRRLGRNILMGGPISNDHHHMEVRGLGIIDVELLFGIGAVREEKRVSLTVDLDRWTKETEVDRLGIDPLYATFLDVPVRQFKIPVESGRNVAILIEVATLQYRIMERGINPAEELNKRLIERMTGKVGG